MSLRGPRADPRRLVDGTLRSDSRLLLFGAGPLRGGASDRPYGLHVGGTGVILGEFLAGRSSDRHRLPSARGSTAPLLSAQLCDAAGPDRRADVARPFALVPAHGVRAEVLPTVALPSPDGDDDRQLVGHGRAGGERTAGAGRCLRERPYSATSRDSSQLAGRLAPWHLMLRCCTRPRSSRPTKTCTSDAPVRVLGCRGVTGRSSAYAP